MHIASGMYGMIVVEPPAGLPKVDHEFYVMQGDFYVQGDRAAEGLRQFDMTKMLAEQPDYVVFNGRVGSLTGDAALKARVGESVRIFFGVSAGGATVVEFTPLVPGTYTLVDHSIERMEKGAAGQLIVEGEDNPEVFQVVQPGTGGVAAT
jgi:nitrite reductase (NO-forming)